MFWAVHCSPYCFAVISLGLPVKIGVCRQNTRLLHCVSLHAFWVVMMMMLLSLYTVSAGILQHAGFHIRNKLMTFLWICVFWDVMLHQWASTAWQFDGSWCRFNVVCFVYNHNIYINTSLLHNYFICSRMLRHVSTLAVGLLQGDCKFV